MTAEEDQEPGAKIRGLREDTGMSQAMLASQAELSQGYLSQIENDEVQNPSAAVLFKIANALFVDPKVILEAAGVDSTLCSPDEMLSFGNDPQLVVFIGKQAPEVQKTLASLLASLMDNSLPTLTETAPVTNDGGAVPPVGGQQGQSLGGTIQSLREKVPLTQWELAGKASLSQGYLSQLEKGDVKNPSAKVLTRIATSIGVHPDELFEAAGCRTARQQQELYQTEEAKIPPELVKLLPKLSRRQQRGLLLLLREMVSLMGSKETEASPALTR